MPGLGELVVIVALLSLLVLWFAMLFDCLRHETTDKAVWLVVIIGLGCVGALIYLFVRRGRRSPTTG